MESIGNWPWLRIFHAEVIRRAARDSAKVIGVDVGFIEPDRDSPRNDVELIQATAEAENVILPVLVEPRGSGESARLVRARNLPELEQEALGTGHVHIDSSDDGIVRQVDLSWSLGDESSWAWSIEVLSAYLDLPHESIRPVGGNRLAVGDIEIPAKMAPRSAGASRDRILADYEMNIGWVGDRGSFERIAADSVINGVFPDGYFRGKIVLYGMYSPGAVLSILAGLLVGFVYERFETRVAAAALIFLMVGTLAAYFYLFNSLGYWAPLTSIHVAMVLSFVFSLMLKMNQVNVALDEEILNLSRAAAQGTRGGRGSCRSRLSKRRAHSQRHPGPIPAAALFKVDRSRGLMTLAGRGAGWSEKYLCHFLK